MSGGPRFLAGIGAVVLVVSALGLAAPSNAELDGPSSDSTAVTVNQ